MDSQSWLPSVCFLFGVPILGLSEIKDPVVVAAAVMGTKALGERIAEIGGIATCVGKKMMYAILLTCLISFRFQVGCLGHENYQLYCILGYPYG